MELDDKQIRELLKMCEKIDEKLDIILSMFKEDKQDSWEEFMLDYRSEK